MDFHSSRLFVYKTLSTDSYLCINKELIKKIGIENAVFLSHLINRERLISERNQLDEEGGFYVKSDYLESDLGITRRVRERIQGSLSDLNLIKIIKKDFPSQNFFYLQFDNILNSIVQEEISCHSAHQTVHTDVQNVHTDVQNVQPSLCWPHQTVHASAHQTVHTDPLYKNNTYKKNTISLAEHVPPSLVDNFSQSEEKIDKKIYSDGFSKFWTECLKIWKLGNSETGSKAEAWKEFKKINPKPDAIEVWLCAAEQQAMARKNSNGFISDLKHVCRWVKYRCWETESTIKKNPASNGQNPNQEPPRAQPDFFVSQPRKIKSDDEIKSAKDLVNDLRSKLKLVNPN